MSSSDKPATATPYRGIHPFRYIDQAYYFGREEIVEELLTRIMLYRLVILFGESGVGKSSLLNAGIIAALKKKGYQPEKLRVQPFKDQPLLVERIQSGGDAGNAFLPSIFFEPQTEADAAAQSRALSLTDFRSKLNSAVKEAYPVLIFDQFEELFTLFKQQNSGESAKGEDPRSRLIQAVVEIVTDTTLKAKIVIAIREDFLAKMDIIAKDYPQIFDHRVHARLLKKENAHSAILRPFDDPNPFASRLTPELADTIVEQLSSGESDASIQPTQLQIICSRLWEKYAAAKAEIGLAEFKEMGEVKGILKGFLTSELTQIAPAQREPAVMILENLITESGTRDVVGKKRLSQSLDEDKNFPISELDAILSNLQKRRLINEVAERGTYYYDLASEFLVEPIQKEREYYSLKRAQRQQRVRYYIWSGVALIVLISIAASIFAYQRREQARLAEAAILSAKAAEDERLQKEKEIEEAEQSRILLTTIAELADDNPQKRKAAQENIIGLAKDQKLPALYLPLVEAIVKKYQPDSASRFTRDIEEVVNSPSIITNQDFSNLKPRIYMRITDDSQQETANKAAESLKAAGYLVPKLQKVSSGPPVNELRYYKESEQGLATEVEAVLKSSGVDNVKSKYLRGYENSTLMRPKHFELWFASIRKPAPETTPVIIGRTKCQECTAIITKIESPVMIVRPGKAPVRAKEGDILTSADAIQFERDFGNLKLECSNGVVMMLFHSVKESGSSPNRKGPWCPKDK
jgi:hypothetical protein